MTIRQLGYPTKNALLSWHREYEQRLELPAGYLRQPRYSQAHKELAVRHYLEHGRCIAATIRALGDPSRSLLSEWLQELHPQVRTRVVGRSRELAPAAKQSAVIALCMRPASAGWRAECRCWVDAAGWRRRVGATGLALQARAEAGSEEGGVQPLRRQHAARL